MLYARRVTDPLFALPNRLDLVVSGISYCLDVHSEDYDRTREIFMKYSTRSN